MAHLVHPHIVRIFDFDVQESAPFLVMDYAPNGNLRQRHPKNMRLPLGTIIAYIKQVADALQYAHDEHFIHRDIKPENMLLGRRNEVLLSDFGIALIAQSTRIQSTQEVVGTAYYMAPEQLHGKPRLASDQYALGIVVYEWLSGSRPFHGSFSEIASQHMFVPPASLREQDPAIPPTLEEVVMTALAKDPHQRFGSVRAFATALKQASESTGATSRTTPPSFPLMQSDQRTPPSQPLVPSEPQPIIQTSDPQPIASFSSDRTSPAAEIQAEVTSANTPASPYEVTPLPALSKAEVASSRTHPAGQPPAGSDPRPVAAKDWSKAPSNLASLPPAKRGLSRRTVLLSLVGLGLAVAVAVFALQSGSPTLLGLTGFGLAVAVSGFILWVVLRNPPGR